MALISGKVTQLLTRLLAKGNNILDSLERQCGPKAAAENQDAFRSKISAGQGKHIIAEFSGTISGTPIKEHP